MSDLCLENALASARSEAPKREPISHHITLRLNLPENDDAHPLRRICERGPDALCDGELLALILRPRVGEDALGLAQELLAAYGGLRALRRAAAPRRETGALGDETLRATLLAAFALGERSAMEPLRRGEPYTSAEDTRRFFEHRLGPKEHEVFAALFLDTRHRLIEYRELFFGTVDSTNIYFREVLRIAMSLNAAALVFCHNHPSGDARPSDADIEITRSLQRVLNLVDVRVLDHIVVTASDSASMMELGLL